MWSPLSFEAGHSVIFGTVALHNRGLRIIGVLRFFAIRGVRAGADPRADASRPISRAARWAVLSTAGSGAIFNSYSCFVEL
jgi:hypothetical protein